MWKEKKIKVSCVLENIWRSRVKTPVMETLILVDVFQLMYFDI